MAGAFYRGAESVVYFAEGCFEGGWEVLWDLEYEWVFVDARVESHCSWWYAFYCAMKVVVDVDVLLFDQNYSFREQLPPSRHGN